MASDQCIIDDKYCIEMGKYFKDQGNQLDQMISDYVAVMQFVEMFGTRDGEVHDAMGEYVEFAKKLKTKFGDISQNAQSQVNKFLTQVDKADQYLF